MKAHSSASCRQTPRWALLPGGGCGGSRTPGRRLRAEHGQRVRTASHRAQPPAQARASPPAPGHACHRGPQATSAWDKKASGVPRAPCLHSCRCEDRHRGGGGGHSPQQEGVPEPAESASQAGAPAAPSLRRRRRLVARAEAASQPNRTGPL